MPSFGTTGNASQKEHAHAVIVARQAVIHSLINQPCQVGSGHGVNPSMPESALPGLAAGTAVLLSLEVFGLGFRVSLGFRVRNVVSLGRGVFLKLAGRFWLHSAIPDPTEGDRLNPKP